jgi:hypothetical protein
MGLSPRDQDSQTEHCCACYAKDLAYEHEPLVENGVLARAIELVSCGQAGVGTMAANEYLEAYFSKATKAFGNLPMPKWDKP